MPKYIGIFLFFIFLLACEKPEQTGMLKIPPGSPAFFKSDLPRPYFEKQDYLSDMYWKAWEILNGKIHQGTSQNGFMDSYLDEGFNELIYQWDSCFMTMFAIYGGSHYPSMKTLDNFYQKQREDGWICRVYQESDGQPPALPSAEDPMINPPLFAWVEWKYYLLTGDKSRFAEVLPVLDAYFNWIDQNCRGAGKAAGLFCNTHLGSGMDNSPREGIDKGAWVDLSAQMALFAKYLMFISRELPDETLSKVYEQRYRVLSRLINSQLWNEPDGFYYDLDQNGRKMPVKTAAAFWTMVAEVATFPQARKLADHLQNPAEFYRSHLFPSLSADDKNYNGNGYYWRGGVWAPINYVIIKGLDMFPLRELAAVAAMNHIKNIYEVYQNFQPDINRIAPEERDGQYQTIWECYAPDNAQPATRWDGQYYSRQDFVGWSGLGPIALLLENVIGLQPSAPEDKLYWNLRMREPHGVENYRFGDNQVDIFCESNELPVGAAVVQINSNSPFMLYISSQIGMQEYQVKAGENRFTIQL
jgi:glycogen debranching enzyme